ncbi:MAG TPA: Rieske 2Fe-2S domain-containing protein, partial [Roseiarcus sp.]|nr:Rieske 2Fe-2S domain-containing protein [Roseiarcus sp.]
MLNTRQKVLQNFWYATVPTDALKAGPKPFRLLGEDIVLFLAGDPPAALKDRCLHRSAKLSKGWVKDGRIVRGYHGWRYDGSGRLRTIPQLPPDQAVPDACVQSFHARDRYGYVWVC